MNTEDTPAPEAPERVNTSQIKNVRYMQLKLEMYL